MIQTRFRFGLRFLFLLLMLVAIAVGWQTRQRDRIRKREKAVQLLEELDNGRFAAFGGKVVPDRIVRAVNYLRGLGKDEAIVALRMFNEKHPAAYRDSTHNALVYVMPLLFQRIDPEDETPFDIRRYQTGMIVKSDLPFEAYDFSFACGEWGGTDFQCLIDWAETSGRLRESPLRPADDLFSIVDNILQASVQRIRDGDEFKCYKYVIRKQAFLMVCELVPEGQFDYPNVYFRANDKDWGKLVDFFSDQPVKWDVDRQRYVFRSPRNASNPTDYGWTKIDNWSRVTRPGRSNLGLRIKDTDESDRTATKVDSATTKR